MRVLPEVGGIEDFRGPVLVPLAIIRTRLDQQDGLVTVLGEPRGQDAAGCAATDDDVIPGPVVRCH
ncbi:MAG: hypothetical protein R3A46_09960 [Thermomicrobiales bacterium]